MLQFTLKQDRWRSRILELKHGANSDGKKPQPIDTSLKNNREIWNKTADIEIRRPSRFIKHEVKIM